MAAYEVGSSQTLFQRLDIFFEVPVQQPEQRGLHRFPGMEGLLLWFGWLGL